MNKKLILILALVFLVGCGVQQPQKEIISETQMPADLTKIAIAPEAPAKTTAIGTAKFNFGIEYGPLGLATAYSETGMHVVKPYPKILLWKEIQGSETANYNWANVDAVVKEYQNAGFNNMHLLITAESPWASRDAAGLIVKDTRPKPEYEDDYVKFVKAAVERYDKDGISDMAGLKYAINEWGVEREFSGFWPGTAAEYVYVLKMAYPAIKQANPNAKVMLNALFMSSIFAGNPSDLEVENRIKAGTIIGNPKKATEVYALLDAVNYYDVVDLHFLGDYSEIAATAKWVKKELAKRNANKEIYGGDAFPMSPLFIGLETCSPGIFAGKEIYPVTPATRCKAFQIVDALKKKTSPNNKKANEWLEKNIAINIPKKFAVSAYGGLTGLNVGNMEDWFVPVGAGTTPYMGLIDSGTKAKRPGFYALKMSAKYLDGFTAVKNIEAGNNVYAYEFTKNGNKAIVAWYDDGKFYGMADITPSINIALPWDKPTAKIIEVPIKRGVQEGSTKTVTAAKGKITFNLGYTTVFVTP